MCNQNTHTDGWSKAHVKPSAKKISFIAYDFPLKTEWRQKNSNDIEVKRKEEEIFEFVSLMKTIGLNFSFSPLLIFCKIVFIPEFPSQCLVHYTVSTFALLWGTGEKNIYILQLGNKTSMILV